MSEYLVPLYDEDAGPEPVGMVTYTENLDAWDGHNMTCGQTGRHLGIGRLKDGRFYLCHGTQWEGERDYAEVVSAEEARRVVMRRRPEIYEELFGEPLPVLSE